MFCLVERLASERQGCTLWFKQMTAIGPMTTPDESERRVFHTREEAERCPALLHALSSFEVRECEP